MGIDPYAKAGDFANSAPTKSLQLGKGNHEPQRRAFSRCHPLVNFLYFALVLLGATVLRHPACQVISLIGAIACFCCLGEKKPGGFRLWYAFGAVRADRRRKPRVQPRGTDDPPLSPVRKPLTLESVLYGLGAGLTLCTALIWFSNYTRVMTSDKFVYLFGRIVPALSLVLSMTPASFRAFPRRQDGFPERRPPSETTCTREAPFTASDAR